METVGREKIVELISNPVLTGFTAGKIVWLRNNEPETYTKVRKILLPKDYIRFCLTGEYATEVSDASGTLLLDVANRKWSDELLAKLDIDRALMPRLHESPEITGQLSRAAGQALGFSPGVPVVGGGG